MTERPVGASGGGAAAGPLSGAAVPPLVVVAGMHRSGTSMVAGLLARCGLQLGESLVPADAANPRGYFEDRRLVRFHGRLLRAACVGGGPGWPDWGWLETGVPKLDPVLPAFADEARAILAEGRRRGLPWGFKDPRATLVLDFWAELAPEAVVVGVYRSPGEVRASVRRLGGPVFGRNPGYADAIWTAYDRSLLDFHRRHPGRCILVNAAAVGHDPDGFLDLVADRSGLALSRPADPLAWLPGSGFTPDTGPEELDETRRRPELAELYWELEEAASLPAEPALPGAGRAPRVSVVIPCRDDGRWLSAAVASVERSRHRAWEVVLVDDGSTDPETLAVFETLSARGHRLVRHERRGLSAARNAGVAVARAPYVLFLDSDNLVEPRYLADAAAVLDAEPHVGVVYADLRRFGCDTAPVRVPSFDGDRLLAGNFVDACAVVRRSALEGVGGLDESMLDGLEDWEIWIRLHSAGWAFHRLPAFLFHYRVRPGSLLSRSRDPEVMCGIVAHVAAVHEELYRRRLPGVVVWLNRFLAWARQSAPVEDVGQVATGAPVPSASDASSVLALEALASALATGERLSETRRSLQALEGTLPVRMARALGGARRFLRDLLRGGRRRLRRSRQGRVVLGRLRDLMARLALGAFLRLERRRVRVLYEPPEDAPPLSRQGFSTPAASSVAADEALALLRRRPCISVLMPVYETPRGLLEEALSSVRRQLYPHWELCVADDGSTSAHVREILERHAAEEPRIRLVPSFRRGGISAATNAAAALATGEYLFFMDHDDLLPADALLQVAVWIESHPDHDLIYADEDKVDVAGVHGDPCHKPAWCPDNLLSRNYLGHPVILRRSLFEELGGLRPAFDGSQDYDLVLRAVERSDRVGHIPRILYHWRQAPGSVAADPMAKPYAYDAARRALGEALERRQEPGRVEEGPFPAHYVVRYRLRRRGMASLIVPTRDGTPHLGPCLLSVLERTTWADFEVVVVDNGSVDPAFFALLDQMRTRDGRIRVVSSPGPFNFSRLIGDGAAAARGDYLVLLNDDTEVVTPDWLEAMMEQAQRPTVGAVGVKLVYPGGRIQHAGVMVGLHGVADHLFVGLDADDPGYFGAAQSVCNYSAVTAACLMVRRSAYDEVGGLDPALAVEYGDTDFCLRLGRRGLRSVYLPHVVLRHHEGASRRSSSSSASAEPPAGVDAATFMARWRDVILSDPCVSPRASRVHGDLRPS